VCRATVRLLVGPVSESRPQCRRSRRPVPDNPGLDRRSHAVPLPPRLHPTDRAHLAFGQLAAGVDPLPAQHGESLPVAGARHQARQRYGPRAAPGGRPLEIRHKLVELSLSAAADRSASSSAVIHLLLRGTAGNGESRGEGANRGFSALARGLTSSRCVCRQPVRVTCQ